MGSITNTGIYGLSVLSGLESFSWGGLANSAVGGAGTGAAVVGGAIIGGPAGIFL